MTSLPTVLFVNPGTEAYGSERSMLRLLQARRFHAEVVCPVAGTLEMELIQLGVKIHPLNFNRYTLQSNLFWHIGFFCRFCRILKQSRPDVIVINLDGNTPWVTLAATLAGIPIVRFCRFEFKQPIRWQDKWSWLKAMAIICPSDTVRQQVLAWNPKHFRGRCYRLYDPFVGQVAIPGEISNFRTRLGLENERIVGFVGRLHRGKRIDTAIEALAVVLKQIPSVRLVIFGGTNNLESERSYKLELQLLANNLRIGESVMFVGHSRAEEMLAAFASFDAIILPSEAESFGMVLMEAWAQGTPTVASDTGGCGEITRKSGAGYLSSVGDVGSFAAHLLELLTHSETARAMGERGKSWVAQNCSLSDYSAAFQAILTSCIRDSK